jgi:hypothetical protein
MKPGTSPSKIHESRLGHIRPAGARRNLLLSFPGLAIAHDGRDVIDSLVEGTLYHLLGRTDVDKMVILRDVAFERLEAQGSSPF